MSDYGWVIWLALIIGAPWALVLVVALVRGYTVTVHLARPRGADTRPGLDE